MKLRGPQSERDGMWSARRDSNRDDLTDRKDSFDSELTRLRNENKSLNGIINRYRTALTAYQVKYPSSINVDIEGGVDDENFPPLNTDPDRVQPLFDHYDTTIRELEDSLKQQAMSMNSLKEKMEALIQENDEYREAQLDNVKNTGFGPNSPLNAELMAELNERIHILMDENALMVEQKVILSAELDSHQNEVASKMQENADLSQALSELSKDHEIIVNRLKQAEKDREEAAKHALKYSENLGKAELEIESLNDQLFSTRQNLKENATLIQDLKRQVQYGNDRNEGDGLTNMRRVKGAEDRVRELQGLLNTKSRELDAANDLVRKLRSEYQNTRQDAEGMLQVMSGLERQLNDYSAREAEVERLAKESKEKYEEALTMKEQCAVRDEQNKREIERLVAERKTIAMQRKDELETVLEAGRKAMQEQSTLFEKEQEEIAAKNAKLIFEAENATRECKSVKDASERNYRLNMEERQGVKATLKDLSEKLSNVTIAKEQETAKRIDMQEQNKELRLTIDKLRTQLDNLRSQHVQLERSKDIDISSYKTSLRDQGKELADKNRFLSKRTKELEDLRANMAGQVAAIEQKFQDENALFRKRAEEADRFAKDLESAGHTGDLRTQTLIDQLKEKYISVVSQLENKLRNEMDQVKSLTNKTRNCETVISEMLEEKANLVRFVEESRAAMKQQDEELDMSRSTIAELTNQLQTSHSAREEGAIRAARTIEDLNHHSMHPKDAIPAWVSSTSLTVGTAGSRNAALAAASTAAGLNAVTHSQVHFKKPDAFDADGSHDIAADDSFDEDK